MACGVEQGAAAVAGQHLRRDRLLAARPRPVGQGPRAPGGDAHLAADGRFSGIARSEDRRPLRQFPAFTEGQRPGRGHGQLEQGEVVFPVDAHNARGRPFAVNERKDPTAIRGHMGVGQHMPEPAHHESRARGQALRRFLRRRGLAVLGACGLAREGQGHGGVELFFGRLRQGGEARGQGGVVAGLRLPRKGQPVGRGRVARRHAPGKMQLPQGQGGLGRAGLDRAAQVAGRVRGRAAPVFQAHGSEQEKRPGRAFVRRPLEIASGQLVVAGHAVAAQIQPRQIGHGRDVAGVGRLAVEARRGLGIARPVSSGLAHDALQVQCGGAARGGQGRKLPRCRGIVAARKGPQRRVEVRLGRLRRPKGCHGKDAGNDGVPHGLCPCPASFCGAGAGAAGGGASAARHRP